MENRSASHIPALTHRTRLNEPHSVVPWLDAVGHSATLNYSKYRSFVGAGRGEGQVQCLPLSLMCVAFSH